MRPSVLAERLHIAARSATEVVDALEARGLVERAPGPGRPPGHPGPAHRGGAVRLAEVDRVRREQSERFLAVLTERDRATLDRILGCWWTSRQGRMFGMRVGLTGGVASGKSTVSAILADLGAVVIDADVLAREVVAPGTDGLAAVVEAFGPTCSPPTASLDRPRWARWCSPTPSAARPWRRSHPRVGDRAAEIEATAPEGAVVVHDIPLLAETGRPTASTR